MSATSYAELSIGLFRLPPESDRVELRFTDPDPDNHAERAPIRGPVTFDREALLASQGEPAEYGRLLAEQLFADPAVRAEYDKVRAVAESSGRTLRLRLVVDTSAGDLGGLRWELLRDPGSGDLLATSERILFSRFLASHDWRPARLRRKAELSALVAVAAPSNLADYRLAEVDAAAEVARAREGLGELPTTVLGLDEPLTLDSLVAALRQGVDILYLVCHGALRGGRDPYLFLQGEDGRAARVAGAELAARLGELASPPRLAVLASCESGGTADGATQGALAPLLSESGVPAVLAMQGQISMETVAKAMPVFFAELTADGQVDRALAVARGTVRDHPDAWMPALYLRLKGGRIWYEPHFAGEENDFARWKSICRRVRQGKCLPVLGPDVAEGVFGSRRELADRLGEAHGFPLSRHERGSLAKVLQYLTVSQDRDYAQGALFGEVYRRILERHPDLLDGEAEERSLPELVELVAAHHREDPSDPYRLLAELPAAVYLSASPDTMLFKALKAAGREPAVLFSSWRPTAESHPKAPLYDGMPSRDKPVLYHVFGVYGRPESLVLTEDDFFDYLIAAATYKLVPTVVRGTLTESSLLFLGFPVGDWTFRVLFRLIMTLEGAAELRRYSHVGVQVNPDEHDLADVERARSYLESYFRSDRGGRSEPRIDIYWGTVGDFLTELRDHLAGTPEDQVPAVVEEAADGWF